jgi:hypothetical protein
MKAKFVKDALNEIIIQRGQDNTEGRFTNIPTDLTKRYNLDDRGNIISQKTTKEIKREKKRKEAQRMLEQNALFKAKFPATIEGIRELEEWADQNAEPYDYVLRPIDLPGEDDPVDIVVYEGAEEFVGKMSEYGRSLRQNYADMVGVDLYNISPINILNWLELDDLHKLRSRREKSDQEEVVPDIIGKMD